MTAFEDLKSQWGNQNQSEPPVDGVNQIMKQIASVQNEQRITNGVLAATGSILIAFFFYVTAYKFQSVMIGLLILIPIIILVYCIGFVMLLLAFKASLSVRFYNYIIISGIITLFVLCLFMAREIKKELQVVKKLKS